jgi:hypothetical protein
VDDGSRHQTPIDINPAMSASYHIANKNCSSGKLSWSLTLLPVSQSQLIGGERRSQMLNTSSSTVGYSFVAHFPSSTSRCPQQQQPPHPERRHCRHNSLRILDAGTVDTTASASWTQAPSTLTMGGPAELPCHQSQARPYKNS